MGKSLPCQNGREKTAKHSKLKEPLSSSGRTDFEVALASNILFKGSVEPSALKDQPTCTDKLPWLSDGSKGSTESGIQQTR